MKLSENELGIAWLRHFSARDVHSARLLLDSLKLVSFTEYEEAISNSLQKLVSKTNGMIAIYTVDKNLIDPSVSVPGSEHRLSHLIRNLQRLHAGRILIKPTIDDMRRVKVDHVVLVDDFICSGQRLEDFWDVLTSSPVRDGRSAFAKKSKKRGTLRSWLSLRYCKLWVVAYAAHEVGLNRIEKAISYLSTETTRFTLLIKTNAQFWPDPVIEFLDRVERANTSGRHRLGWGNLMIPLVFQYGCPDNCPELLWKKSLQFSPLFPNRAIPLKLYPCFEGHNDSGRGPSLLFDAGQSRLAITLLDDMATGIKGSQYVDILTLLGLILSGYAVRNIPGIMLRDEAEVANLVETAKEMALLDADSKITPFGRDITNRSRRSFLTTSSPKEDSHRGEAYYLPTQFQNRLCGAQRKTRNEPDPNS